MKFGTIKGNAYEAMMCGVMLDCDLDSFLRRMDAARIIRVRNICVYHAPDGFRFTSQASGKACDMDYVVDQFAGYGIEIAAGLQQLTGSN